MDTNSQPSNHSEATTIEPVNSRSETLGLVTFILVILSCWAVLLYQRQRQPEGQEIKAWQISAFTDLKQAEQGLYSDLRIAAEEIGQIKQDEGGWPALASLQDEGMAPFAQNMVWKQRGSLTWQAHHDTARHEDVSVFLGVSPCPEISGSFLLTIHQGGEASTEQCQYEIWRLPATATPPPNEDATTLRTLGWKQIVAYQGDDEVQRIKGK
jgi:hypothetical protein